MVDESVQDEKRSVSQSVDEAIEVASDSVRGAVVKGVGAAESIGENIKDTVRGMRNVREHAVMVRLDDEGLEKINILIEAGIVSSRSEGAAFLIGEGIKLRKPLFDSIRAKIEEIRKAREDLRQILDVEDTGTELLTKE